MISGSTELSFTELAGANHRTPGWNWSFGDPPPRPGTELEGRLWLRFPVPTGT